jgi:hypothetical protein
MITIYNATADAAATATTAVSTTVDSFELRMFAHSNSPVTSKH